MCHPANDSAADVSSELLRNIEKAPMVDICGSMGIRRYQVRAICVCAFCVCAFCACVHSVAEEEDSCIFSIYID